MLFAPLICCSRGAPIDCATTPALAPGKFVATCTCGGTICGYCEIGSPSQATAPASVMTSDRTEERTGRSMKKSNTGLAALPVAGRLGWLAARWARFSVRAGCGRRSEHGLHLHPGPHLVDPLCDDELARLQPALHDPVVVEPGLRHDLAVLDLVVRADDEDRAPVLELLDRALRHSDRVRFRPGGEENPDELTGTKQALRVGDREPDLQGPDLRIDRRVDEIEPAGELVFGPVGELQPEPRRLARVGVGTRSELLPQLGQPQFADREVHVQ